VSWFRREKKRLESTEEKRVHTEGLWTKCESCRQIIWKKDLEANWNVCPRCNFHFKIDSRMRLALLLDGKWTEHDAELTSSDPLEFNDLKSYRERLPAMKKKTGMADAVVMAEGRLDGRPVIVCSMEYNFIGGSMGAVVGEKITRAIELSIRKRAPLIIVSASGGARMMEGAVSLMQMAKISAALARLDEARIPYISVCTDPTTGGTLASFAMLGDLNIAEPGALIGFTGPRVIEQTIRQKLPADFQRSEFLLEHGALDAVVNRKELKSYIARALQFCTWAAEAQSGAGLSDAGGEARGASAAS
jgi:acetyl-CoA carboxylase carboxyl transferase subunit beta